MRNNIEFRFSKPGGVTIAEPSTRMKNALTHLSQSDEIRRLAADAKTRGRKLVVHVFHSAKGHPILIHLGDVPEDATRRLKRSPVGGSNQLGRASIYESDIAEELNVFINPRVATGGIGTQTLPLLNEVHS